MKDKYLYIIDIRFKQKDLDLSKYITNRDCKILSLTPYSSYLLEEIKKEFVTYHEDVVSIVDFRDTVFKTLYKVENIVKDYKDLSYIIYYITLIINKLLYYNYLSKYIEKEKSRGYNIYYISDTEINLGKKYDLMSNEFSNINNFEDIFKTINLNSKDKIFYYIKKYKILFIKLFNYNTLSKIFNKEILRKKLFLYDNIYFQSFFEKIKLQRVKYIKNNDYFILKNELLNILNSLENKNFNEISDIYNDFFYSLEQSINIFSKETTVKVEPFIFLSNNQDFLRNLIYKQNCIPRVFMQHGSYLYENFTLKFCEVYPADYNFVFNEYTKNLFLKRGARNVEVIGSRYFNKEYNNDNIIYDYVYITFCSSYIYSGSFVGMENSIVSMDGMSIFKRHKEVIELFGKKFTTKKLCIKIQPSIMTSNLYIPFLELTKEYKNIEIEYLKPLSKIINSSKYIISDYFSSEFNSRDIHYKKDIILFKSSPYPLHREILEDMGKMFILIDNIDDLNDKIENIKDITDKRNRDDKIIEYYSSSKDNGLKKGFNILEKVFNER